MRIGLIVEGEAEFRSLPQFLRRLEIEHETVGRPLLARVHPLATKARIVAAIASGLTVLKGKRADMALVLLDRETREDCPGDWAQRLESMLNRAYARLGFQRIAVVVKDRCFENWLISDPDALATLKGRFKVSNTKRHKIEPNKADNVTDAQGFLEAAVKTARKNESYNKIQDAVRMLDRADPLRMAANSRSFRRLLRLLGHAAFRGQSKRPVSSMT